MQTAVRLPEDTAVKIRPVDLKQKEFTSRMRGYDTEEVRAFLDKVAEEFAEQLRHSQALEERLNDQNHVATEYRTKEQQINSTLVLAQKIREDIEKNAKKEAELLVQESRVEAERILAASRKERDRLQRETEALREQRNRYLSELKSLLDTHRNMIDLLMRESGGSALSSSSGPSNGSGVAISESTANPSDGPLLDVSIEDGDARPVRSLRWRPAGQSPPSEERPAKPAKRRARSRNSSGGKTGTQSGTKKKQT